MSEVERTDRSQFLEKQKLEQIIEEILTPVEAREIESSVFIGIGSICNTVTSDDVYSFQKPGKHNGVRTARECIYTNANVAQLMVHIVLRNIRTEREKKNERKRNTGRDREE